MRASTRMTSRVGSRIDWRESILDAKPDLCPPRVGKFGVRGGAPAVSSQLAVITTDLSVRGLQMSVVRADLTGAEPAIGSTDKSEALPQARNMAAPLGETRLFAFIELSSERRMSATPDGPI